MTPALAGLGGYSKTVVAVVGMVVSILTSPEIVPLLPEAVARYVGPIVAVLTIIGVYAVPNRAGTPSPPAAEAPAPPDDSSETPQ